MNKTMELITVVVQRRDGQKAVDAALKAGAPGVTTYYGRGTGVRQKLKVFGFFIEAEKQIILVATTKEHVDKILGGIVKELELDKPGKGFAYVQSIDRVVGYYEGGNDKNAA
ncbi:MAG TPA: P-II family nitrogen regulator [Elusimicrobiales bacterium]|mgnify:CR=1 FL=1|nr:P-II family nitrogen regulator [Elusimicrobiales bacterium]